MENNATFFDNNSPSSILRAKLEWHNEQVKVHKRLAKETKDALDRISDGTEVPTVYQTTDEILHYAINNTHLDTNFSVGNWRNKIRKVFSESNGEALRTVDILEKIDNNYNSDKELRRKAIITISNVLSNLIRNGEIESYEFEGQGKKYSTKKTILK